MKVDSDIPRIMGVLSCARMQGVEETDGASGRLSCREFAHPTTKAIGCAQQYCWAVRSSARNTAKNAILLGSLYYPRKLTEEYHNCDVSWLILAKSFPNRGTRQVTVRTFSWHKRVSPSMPSQPRLVVGFLRIHRVGGLGRASHEVFALKGKTSWTPRGTL